MKAPFRCRWLLALYDACALSRPTFRGAAVTNQLVAALLLALWSTLSGAASLCPATTSRQDWSARCFEQRDDGRHVKAAYRKNIHVDRRGVALILIGEPRELVAVDRGGKVVVPGILHTGDFDYPSEQSGMSRFTETVKDASGTTKERCGYFSTKRFRIVVPAQFDACHAFHDGKADACTDCTRYCTEPECQNSVLIGGQGYAVQPDGSVHRQGTVPSKERLCSRPELLQERVMYEGRTWLQCNESLFQVPPRDAPAQ